MPVVKPEQGAFVNRIQNRKSRKRSAILPSAKARERPELRDIPAVVVRLRDRAEPVELINLPVRDDGADMVLHLIAAFPAASLMTRDLEYVGVKDIVRVDCPERGEIMVEAARCGPASSMSFRPAELYLGTRNRERVGIANIPDTPDGWKLLRSILVDYRSVVGGGPSGYTLMTADWGYIPVWELAMANKE